MKSLLLTRSDPHTFCPASSGAPSLLATGSLCERIPAFSQRQSPCEAGSERVGREGEGRMAATEREKGDGVRGWGRKGRSDPSHLNKASSNGRSHKMLEDKVLEEQQQYHLHTTVSWLLLGTIF